MYPLYDAHGFLNSLMLTIFQSEVLRDGPCPHGAPLVSQEDPSRPFRSSRSSLPQPFRRPLCAPVLYTNALHARFCYQNLRWCNPAKTCKSCYQKHHRNIKKSFGSSELQTAPGAPYVCESSHPLLLNYQYGPAAPPPPPPLGRAVAGLVGAGARATHRIHYSTSHMLLHRSCTPFLIEIGTFSGNQMPTMLCSRTPIKMGWLLSYFES